MVGNAEYIAIVVLILAASAEYLHLQRIRRLSRLAFGSKAKPGLIARIGPWLRTICWSTLAWGLVTLLIVEPKTGGLAESSSSKQRHVILLLDVSPSMRLVDAGPDHKLSRMNRARAVLESFFDRVPIQQYRVSLIAFYNSAIPVVIDTRDMEVIKNCLSDLPMHFAFKGKNTDLFAGLTEAAKTAAPWNPKSTILIVITDGDTVPAQGMPKMPASISGVMVIGVGDPVSGKFIDGRHSKQDLSTLRQVAARMSGEYHNGNEQHISTSMIERLTADSGHRKWQDLTRRDYALMAIGFGACILALLPITLHYFGTTWHPGTHQ